MIMGAPDDHQLHARTAPPEEEESLIDALSASRQGRLRLGALVTTLVLAFSGGVVCWTVLNKPDVPITDRIAVAGGQGMRDRTSAIIEIPGTLPQRRHLALTLSLSNPATVGDCVHSARFDVSPVIDGQQWPPITGVRAGRETRIDLIAITHQMSLILDLHVADPSCTVNLGVGKAVLYN